MLARGMSARRASCTHDIPCTPLTLVKAGVAPDVTLWILICKPARLQGREPPGFKTQLKRHTAENVSMTAWQPIDHLTFAGATLFWLLIA